MTAEPKAGKFNTARPVRRGQIALVAVLTGAGLASCTAAGTNAAPVRSFERVADAQALIGPYLKDGETLTHSSGGTYVFRGPLGPDTGIVALSFRLAPGGERMTGFALLPDGDGWTRIDLPGLAQDWWLYEKPAVLFEDLDGDGIGEFVVAATYMTGFGPAGARPFNYSTVIDWQGTEFIRRPDAEDRMGELTAAEAIRSALIGLAPGP